MSIRAKRGPETVSLLLWDGERVLLVRRSAGGLFPHTWTLPGAESEKGEQAEIAAMRVAPEVLGVESGHVRLVSRLAQPTVFRDERGPDSVVRLMTWAGDPTAGPAATRWFTLDELTDLHIFREARDTLRQLCAGMAPHEAATP